MSQSVLRIGVWGRMGFVAAIGLWAVGCSDDEAADDERAPTDVSLAFTATVGEQPFRCDQTFSGLGASGSTVEPLDFRLYVHDVRLVTTDGTEINMTLTPDNRWQTDAVALLDFEDQTGTCVNGTPDVNTTVRGQVSMTQAQAADVDGVKFKVGVPFGLNHADVATAPSPLNLSTMFWSWNAGYKFLRVDTRVQAEAGPIAYNMHLGSTGCQGDAQQGGITGCDQPNVAEVSLTGVDVSLSTIIADYAKLVDGVDLTVNTSAPGCMSGLDDTDCVKLFEHLGLAFGQGGAQPAGQTFFRVQ
jgi:uncharacterized repeat protein (TIGR04052 family)